DLIGLRRGRGHVGLRRAQALLRSRIERRNEGIRKRLRIGTHRNDSLVRWVSSAATLEAGRPIRTNHEPCGERSQILANGTGRASARGGADWLARESLAGLSAPERQGDVPPLRRMRASESVEKATTR